MTLEEMRKGNRIALLAVAATVLTIGLTLLVKSVIEMAGTSQRLTALEKVVETQQKEIQVIHQDIKELLRPK